MKELTFLALTNEIMKPKNNLHKYLFDFDDNVSFKVFLAILSLSTTIYKKTKEIIFKLFQSREYWEKIVFYRDHLF